MVRDRVVTGRGVKDMDKVLMMTMLGTYILENGNTINEAAKVFKYFPMEASTKDNGKMIFQLNNTMNFLKLKK